MMKGILGRMKRLSASEFENLVYDLMGLRGLQNAIWRTPGADGGRDIQGIVNAFDLSGALTAQSWYVECKRYRNSLDWPTVRGKVAFAENHRADYLLICTTANLSPACKDEADRWDKKGTPPKIRFLDGAALENAVSQEPALIAKYRLSSDSTASTAIALFPLVELAAKAVQAAHGKASLSGSPGKEIELGAALIDLVMARVSQLEAGSRSFSAFNIDEDLYDWVDAPRTVRLNSFDAYGLRAILSAIRFVTSSERLAVSSGTDRAIVVLPGAPPHSLVGRTLLRTIALWSHCEVRFLKKTTSIEPRR